MAGFKARGRSEKCVVIGSHLGTAQSLSAASGWPEDRHIRSQMGFRVCSDSGDHGLSVTSSRL
jgi:hypothetical protein